MGGFGVTVEITCREQDNRKVRELMGHLVPDEEVIEDGVAVLTFYGYDGSLEEVLINLVERGTLFVGYNGSGPSTGASQWCGIAGKLYEPHCDFDGHVVVGIDSNGEINEEERQRAIKYFEAERCVKDVLGRA